MRIRACTARPRRHGVGRRAPPRVPPTGSGAVSPVWKCPRARPTQAPSELLNLNANFDVGFGRIRRRDRKTEAAAVAHAWRHTEIELVRDPSGTAPAAHAARVGPQLTPSTAHRAGVADGEVERHLHPLGRLPSRQRDLGLLRGTVGGGDGSEERPPHARHKRRDRRKADLDVVVWERDVLRGVARPCQWPGTRALIAHPSRQRPVCAPSGMSVDGPKVLGQTVVIGHNSYDRSDFQ